MRAAILTLAFVLSVAAPAAAVTVSAPVDKTDFDAVHNLQTESSLPVRELRRTISPIVTDPSDHLHVVRTLPNPLIDLITTRDNKAHAVVQFVFGRK